jgi:hypothetical protein
MEDNKNVEIWWSDLLKKYKNYMGADYDLIDDLDKYILQLPEKDKQVIIEFLTAKATTFSDGFAIAFSTLEKHCNSKSLNKIYSNAQAIGFADQNIIYPLRVIAKQGNDLHRQLLEKFFCRDELNNLEEFVQWSLYPKFPDLFVKSYSKYLRLTDYKQWAGSAITQSFMYEPFALGLLKKHLEQTDKKTWSFVINDIKTELRKAIWTAEQKKAIREIISAA